MSPSTGRPEPDPESAADPVEGHDQPWQLLFGQPAVTTTEAQQLLARIRQQALVDEAEQAAHGIRHLTVVHGDMETDEDVQRMRELWQWADAYTIIVLVAIVTSLMAPPLLRWAMGHLEQNDEENLRRAEHDSWAGTVAVADR